MMYSMRFSEQLAQVNDRQKQAVTASQDPLLVLAGAGSGKTRVLALRIGYLIAEGLVEPEHILALTFTNKAAAEMRGRVRELLRSAEVQTPDVDRLGTRRSFIEPVLSTFHSLGVRMLRLHGMRLGVPAGFSIIDGDDQQRVLKQVHEALEVPESLTIGMAQHFIHSVKNSGLSPTEVATSYRSFIGTLLLNIFDAYEQRLLRQGVVDLDDLVRLPTKLLTEHVDIRRYYQDLFQHVLVDEYQDTNPVQYQFLRALCPPSALSVVGDDAQSIYGFRGSDISNILNFEKDFPQARVVVLDQNYRSTVPILAVASAVLRHSAEQKPKELWTERPGGKRVVIREFADEQAEALHIVESIISHANPAEDVGAASELEQVMVPEPSEYASEKPFSVLDYLLASRSGRSSRQTPRVEVQLSPQHGPLSRYAVLYRTHAQSRVLESAFIAAGVPYRVVGGLRFFDRKEIKDALAFLRVLANPLDELAWARAAGAVKRGVGEKALVQLAECVPVMEPLVVAGEFLAAWAELEARVRVEAHAKLAQFVSFFADLARKDKAESLPLIVHSVLHDSGLLAQYATGDPALADRYDNLREFESVAARYATLPWRAGLQGFLDEAALMTEGDAADQEDDAVTLMTLHAAKGLEFEVVFFAGLEEGLLPHSRSMADPKSLAEEVRLAYVGITRAREELYLTYARQRGVFGESRVGVPSRFLRDLPDDSVRREGGRIRRIPVDDGAASGIYYEPYETDIPF